MEQLRISSSFYVSYKYLTFCWSIELMCVLYYVPRPLINQAPLECLNYIYTTCIYVTQTYKYIYMYRFNPVESNYRDGPVGEFDKTNIKQTLT